MTAASTAASYFSSFINTANDKYRKIVNSDADGETEDESHVSRVLRAYYSEKGRTFPEWLPPDPKAPPPQVAAPISSQSGYGGYGRGAPGGGLSDLWDRPGSGQQQQQQSLPGSLRRGGMGDGRPAPGGPAPGGSRFGDLYNGRSGSAGGQYQQAPQAQPGFRMPGRDREQSAPLPSPAPSGASGGTAKDLLKAKLWGGSGGSRTTSPAPSPGNASGYGRDMAQQDRYAGGNDNGNGGEARFGNSGSQSIQQTPQFSTPSYGNDLRATSSYGDDGRGAYGGGASGSSRPNPYTSNSWSSAGDGSSASSGGGGFRGYGGGYGGGQYGQPGSNSARIPPGGGRMGLPSGPKPQR